VVLAAIIGTVKIALSQPDQTATTKTQSRRTPSPEGAPPIPAIDPEPRPVPRPRPARPGRTGRAGGSPAPVMMTPAMPAGFQWIEARPVPRVRSGFALLVLLAVVAVLLAIAVAGVVVAASVALRGALA
jgi:hypothetical protein